MTHRIYSDKLKINVLELKDSKLATDEDNQLARQQLQLEKMEKILLENNINLN